MYCTFIFYVICFLKFIIHTTNFEMVKSEIVKLTSREKTDVSNANITMS
jgi:hypothetical protein